MEFVCAFIKRVMPHKEFNNELLGGNELRNKRLFIEVCVLVGIIIIVLVVGIQNKKKSNITSQEESSIVQEKENTDRYEHIQEIMDEFENRTKSKQETIVLLQQEFNKVIDIENTQAMTKRVEKGEIDREKIKNYKELQSVALDNLKFQLPGDSNDYKQEIKQLENGKVFIVINANKGFQMLVMQKYKAPTFQVIIDCLKEETAQQCRAYLVKTYGKEVLDSGYMYQKITENSVIQDINNEMSSEEIAFLPALLVTKYISLVNGTMDQGSINFEDEYIKAMQTGRGKNIIIKIYDNEGYFWSVVIASNRDIDHRELINCILATAKIE